MYHKVLDLDVTQEINQSINNNTGDKSVNNNTGDQKEEDMWSQKK
jgi:hypothetical protein